MKGNLAFTTVNHLARIFFGISTTEYFVADSVYHLQANPTSDIQGWCYAKSNFFIEFFGISKATYFRSVETLIEKGLIERHPETAGLLRTTQKWYDKVVFKAQSQNETPVSQGDKDGLKMRQNKSQNETTTIIRIKNKDNNNIHAHKKYSSIKDITETELREVADYYNIPISLVRGSYENLVNYCEAKGKVYKNYLAALRNFTKTDAERKGVKVHSAPVQVVVKHEEVFKPIPRDQFENIKKQAYQRIGKSL